MFLVFQMRAFSFARNFACVDILLKNFQTLYEMYSTVDLIDFICSEGLVHLILRV